MRTIAALLITIAACTDPSYVAPEALVGDYEARWSCFAGPDECYPEVPGGIAHASIHSDATIEWGGVVVDQGVPGDLCLHVNPSSDHGGRSAYDLCARDGGAVIDAVSFSGPRSCDCTVSLRKL